jgi:hypothetical protein
LDGGLISSPNVLEGSSERCLLALSLCSFSKSSRIA